MSKKYTKALEKDGHASALEHGARSKSFASRSRGWARNWLFNQALPLWADIGLDREYGGAYEALNLDGKPITDMGRRFRVQARQVYAFAQAYELGWKQGADALLSPLNYMLDHCWLDTGGWGHVYNRDGSLRDGKIDTYDQAFALLGLGWAYKVTGEKRVLEAANKTKRASLQQTAPSDYWFCRRASFINTTSRQSSHAFIRNRHALDGNIQ